jgi:hypothetical protein
MDQTNVQDFIISNNDQHYAVVCNDHLKVYSAVDLFRIPYIISFPLTKDELLL